MCHVSIIIFKYFYDAVFELLENPLLHLNIKDRGLILFNE